MHLKFSNMQAYFYLLGANPSVHLLPCHYRCLAVDAPSPEEKLSWLSDIAQEHSVEWDAHAAALEMLPAEKQGGYGPPGGGPSFSAGGPGFGTGPGSSSPGFGGGGGGGGGGYQQPQQTNSAYQQSTVATNNNAPFLHGNDVTAFGSCSMCMGLLWASSHAQCECHKIVL